MTTCVNAFEQMDPRMAKQGLRAIDLSTLQVNIGLRCNQSCTHCHLDCSPTRTEQMSWPMMERIVAVARTAQVQLVDITGGAPELHPDIRRFIDLLSIVGLGVQLRTNFTALLEPEAAGLIDLLRQREVRLVGSLPCYTAGNVDRQRGQDVFNRSTAAIKLLNAAGYGVPGGLQLNLVYNPGGPGLPGNQVALEQDYRRRLEADHGVHFSHLLTITNVPIGRFAAGLRTAGKDGTYRALLEKSFNPATLDGLMCRHHISVAWDGTLSDCDFNLALGLPVGSGAPAHLDHFDAATLAQRRVVTGPHCLACTAGQGSSCSGALA